MKVKQRKSNLELLRIISIFLILLGHIVWETEWVAPSNISLTILGVQSLWIGGKLGVNIFFLIMGYFLSKHYKFSLKRLMSLWSDVLLYSWIILIIAIVFQFPTLSLRNVLASIFPIIMNCYWFITVYIFLYMLSPVLSRVISKLKQSTYTSILIIGYIYLFVFSAMFNNTTGGAGDTFITGLYVYFLGAYINKFGIDKKICKSRFLLPGIILTIIIMILSILSMDTMMHWGIISYTPQRFSQFIDGDSPFQIILAVFLFSLFNNMEISDSYIINKYSQTTLAVYMLHTNYLTKDMLFKRIFKFQHYQDNPIVFLYMFLTALTLCLLFMNIDLLKKHLVDKKKIELIGSIVDNEKINEFITRLGNRLNRLF